MSTCLARWLLPVVLGLSPVWTASAQTPAASAGAPAMAANPAAEVPADPALERRLLAIADLLRCLVCQNQTLADSHAELAVDLKNQIREQLRQGRSDEQIQQFMVERYGDFVLYKPPLNAATAALWFGPALLLLGAALTVVALVRRRRSGEGELTQDDRRAADDLLGQADPGAPRN